ncbi:MAG: transposase [Thermoguttaceae bacterium]|nr:transposase [Thermoguttaceae bacterium]
MYKYWFVTFSTFGSWLPGDERGSHRWNGDAIKPNRALQSFVQIGMRREPVRLINASERQCAFQAIVESCKKRGWSLGALNVRTEHVHMLVYTELEEESETIAQAVKSKATQRLRRYFERFKADEPVWSRGYDSLKVENLDMWRETVKYTLLKQESNDYLSSEQWLNYSRYWVVNPYRFERRGLVVFDGKELKYSLREDLLSSSRRKLRELRSKESTP